MLPITSMAAAAASLKDKNLVPERRKKIGDVRNDTFSFLDKHNFSFVPSVSNCFMVDVKRPGGQIVAALAKEKVIVGRVWRAWPNHVRVTVGLPDEMEKFKAAFLKVMA
jgi:histidinol-phosphate/aromatic aminotransferase/cobyric acid decarboxylase-like protein